MSPRLDIVGCGRVGQSLGRAFAEAGRFEIGRVVTRSLASARRAADFIGAGEPGDGLRADRPADVVLIAAPDAAIADCARTLAAAGGLGAGAVAFHASGALASTVLAPLAASGLYVASVHPVRSFAEPARAAVDFPGTRCAIEGDAAALAVLRPAFESIGAVLFQIGTGAKPIYHASTVIASNDLVALFDVARDAFAQAGLDADAARDILLPLMHGTLDNLERAEPAAALTGPIARGDVDVVVEHLTALDAWQPEVGALYRALGRRALALARVQGSARASRLDALAARLAAAHPAKGSPGAS